jgi:hypothetical protein
MDYEIEEEIIKAKEEEQEQEEKTERWQDGQLETQEEIEVKDPTQYLVDKLKSV